MQKRNLLIVKTATLTIFLLASAAYGLLHIEKHVERVSVNSDGSEASCEIGDHRAGYCGDSYNWLQSSSPSISANGRYVVFESTADNLVAGVTSDEGDIFIRDRVAGKTHLVSISSEGTKANRSSVDPRISADGRCIAFWSRANNLVPNDTNHEYDLFVRDRITHTTRRVNVSSEGKQTTGYHWGWPVSISANCRYIAFISDASNLVNDDTNNVSDIFVHDRIAGTTERVNVSSTEEQANHGANYSPSISADGRYVVFASYATNLVSNDTNNEGDLFVRDRIAGTTERVNVSSTEEQANRGVWSGEIAISANGRYVVFGSYATNLVADDTNNEHDVFVRDRQSGTTQRVNITSEGEQTHSFASFNFISADGRYVFFNSRATNLAPGNSNGWPYIYVRDLFEGTTERIVLRNGKWQVPGDTGPSIFAGGLYFVFASRSSVLVPNDTNGASDIFLYYETITNTKDQAPPAIYLLLQDKQK